MTQSEIDWEKAWETFWDRSKRIVSAMGRQKRAQGTPTAGLLHFRGLRLILLCTLVASLVLPAGCAGREASSNVIWRDLTITPSEVSIGEKVLIEFWIDIRPYLGVTTDVTLRIDNKDIQTKKVYAEERSTTKAFFRVTAETVGTHIVSIRAVGIDKLTGTFTVIEPE